MLKPLRAEMNALLADTPVRRKPALRRAGTPDALLATDLPLAADAQAVDGFLRRARLLGWCAFALENGWLLLDKPVPTPVNDDAPELDGPCGCCLSLLRRHPETGDPRPYIRQVLQAQEAGAGELLRLCQRMHAGFAAMLRLHQPLPGALLPYLTHACRTHRDALNKRKE